MEVRAQWNALSSAASYGPKLPCTSSTKLSFAGAGRNSSRPDRRGNSQKRATLVWAEANTHFQRSPQNKDLPRAPPKHKKKPWITPPKPGGFLRKLKRGPPKLRRLPAPDNGLLVPRLIPLAHHVLEARKAVIHLVPKLMQVVPVQTCKFCTDTHVGPVGHEIATCSGQLAAKRRSRHDWTRAKPSDVFPSLDAYHLYDRLKTIYHTERFGVPRLPALLELCIQAGVELPDYPVLRRKRPVKAIGKRIVEENTALFEFDNEVDPYASIISEASSIVDDDDDSESSELDDSEDESLEVGNEHDVDINTINNQEMVALSEGLEQVAEVSRLLDAHGDMTSLSSEEVAHVAQVTLDTWERMRKGVKKLMVKYPVRVCGYCPEVHVGPRGHKVKVCGAFKHQWRAGQHGWQKATLDDLIPPKFVWHVQDLQAPLLHNQLRRYYGQAPAVVELCVQAGAMIPSEYRPLMRVDVVVPEIDEIYNAV